MSKCPYGNPPDSDCMPCALDEALEALERVRDLAEYIGSSPDIESQNIALAIEIGRAHV